MEGCREARAIGAGHQ